jgi:hypothetical protein
MGEKAVQLLPLVPNEERVGRAEYNTSSQFLAIEKGERMTLTTSLASRNLGMILLALWLILTGLLPLLNMRFSATVTTGLAVLAIAAGVLILLRR